MGKMILLLQVFCLPELLRFFTHKILDFLCKILVLMDFLDILGLISCQLLFFDAHLDFLD